MIMENMCDSYEFLLNLRNLWICQSSCQCLNIEIRSIDLRQWFAFILFSFRFSLTGSYSCEKNDRKKDEFNRIYLVIFLKKNIDNILR